MDRTITEESRSGSLESKKDFLIKFLKQKLLELGDKQASLLTLGESEKNERKVTKGVRFKKGDRIFWMAEVSDQEDGESVEDNDEDFSAIFALNERAIQTKSGKPKENTYPKKSWPLRCSKEHSNGLLFFCNTYKKKILEERRAIQKKIHLCCTCLGKAWKDHQCPKGKCSRCGALHNVLLCNRSPEANVLSIKENNDNEESDSDDENIDDFESNQESIHVNKPKEGAKVETGKKKSTKQGKENKDPEAKEP